MSHASDEWIEAMSQARFNALDEASLKSGTSPDDLAWMVAEIVRLRDALGLWHHLQIVDGDYYVDGVLSTKAKHDGMAQRAKETHPASGGGDWALVKSGAR